MSNGTQTINIGERRLKMLIKETIKESLNAEILKLRAALLPYVGGREQKEIERKYGKPSRKIAKTYECEI